MVNIHKCKDCGADIYWKRSGSYFTNGEWFKMNPETKQFHDCNEKLEELIK